MRHASTECASPQTPKTAAKNGPAFASAVPPALCQSCTHRAEQKFDAQCKKPSSSGRKLKSSKKQRAHQQRTSDTFQHRNSHLDKTDICLLIIPASMRLRGNLQSEIRPAGTKDKAARPALPPQADAPARNRSRPPGDGGAPQRSGQTATQPARSPPPTPAA